MSKQLRLTVTWAAATPKTTSATLTLREGVDWSAIGEAEHGGTRVHLTTVGHGSERAALAAVAAMLRRRFGPREGSGGSTVTLVGIAQPAAGPG